MCHLITCARTTQWINNISTMICRPRQWSSQLSKSEKVCGSHATAYFIKEIEEFFSPLWRCCLTPAVASSVLRFLCHTQRRTTVGRTPLDKWSACRRDLSLTNTTHNKLLNRNLSRRAVADLHIRPRGYWDRRNGGVGCRIWIGEGYKNCSRIRKS